MLRERETTPSGTSTGHAKVAYARGLQPELPAVLVSGLPEESLIVGHTAATLPFPWPQTHWDRDVVRHHEQMGLSTTHGLLPAVSDRSYHTIVVTNNALSTFPTLAALRSWLSELRSFTSRCIESFHPLRPTLRTMRVTAPSKWRTATPFTNESGGTSIASWNGGG